MSPPQPLFDSETHYRIRVRGCVDPDWLQSFDASAQIAVGEAGPAEDITALELHTDQSGVVGLLRRLHGLGIAILQLEIVAREER